MKKKSIFSIFMIFLAAASTFIGCSANGSSGSVEALGIDRKNLNLITPDNTIELCLAAIKTGDKKVLKEIGLTHYVETLGDPIESESESTLKAYYSDRIAKEFHFAREFASYENTIKELSDICQDYILSEPQRIVGGSDEEVDYKIVAESNGPHYADEYYRDLWIKLNKANNGNWYVSRITKKIECDWFGNEKITEKSKEDAEKYLKQIDDASLLKLFEMASATQLNHNKTWQGGFQAPSQLSWQDITDFYIQSLSKEELDQCYDAGSGQYMLPVMEMGEVAAQYLSPDSHNLNETYFFQNTYRGESEFLNQVTSLQSGEAVLGVTKDTAEELKYFPVQNMELTEKKVLPEGCIYLEAVCYNDGEEKEVLNHQKLMLWMSDYGIRYRSYEIIPPEREEKGNRFFGQFALMPLESVQVSSSTLEENNFGYLFEEAETPICQMIQTIHITGEYKEGEISEDIPWSERFLITYPHPDSIQLCLAVGNDNGKKFLFVSAFRGRTVPDVSGDAGTLSTGGAISLTTEMEGFESHFYKCDNIDLINETAIKLLEQMKDEKLQE